VIDLNALGGLLSTYGLPLTILIVFGWLILSGRLRTEGEFTTVVAQLNKDLDFRERLRAEERTSRLDAETRLSALTGTMREQSALLQEISRDVLRGQAASGGNHDGR
jgi:hypothetical protein